MCGVQVNGMDTTRTVEAEGEDVVARRGDCKNDVIWGYLEEARVGAIVFPGESVDVGVVEAGVFREALVVVDAPVVVLVPTCSSAC